MMIYKTDRERNAYYAALVDGEGGIGIVQAWQPKGKRQHQLRIRTWNTKPAPLYLGKKYFGGNISEQHKERIKSLFVWTLTGYKALSFLTKILPFMQIKHEQAKLAIEFMALPRFSRCEGGPIALPKKDWDEREGFSLAIKKLNHI